MPDPDRRTISATQSPALFNASPYITRFMLYYFLKGGDIEPAVTSRMSWGTKLQPLVLEQAAADLKLEILPNMSNQYVRATFAPIGCTADALIRCPDRGPGTIETKCVFDYGTWMREWNGGKSPPRHYELQLQHQLAVGDGTNLYEWGVIAAWVGGEMHYFERTRDKSVSGLIAAEAIRMMEAVAGNDEPDPFGAAVESPLLATAFPVVKGKTLDLRAHPDGHKWADHAAMYADFRKQQAFYDKAQDAARAELMALVKDNETVLLPEGVTVKRSQRQVKEHMRKASTQNIITVKIGEAGGDGAEPEGFLG
jgi:predicted phage-related endonuclease